MIDVLGERVKPLASACVQKLAAFLAETCANPKNPTFSHFLFEGVSGLLRHAATDTQSMAAFEQALFPPFQFVLQQDVVEFAPYVFQLLAQMIEARNCDNGDALPASYLGIFPALLAPSLWDRQANVTPLVRLLGRRRKPRARSLPEPLPDPEPRTTSPAFWVCSRNSPPAARRTTRVSSS